MTKSITDFFTAWTEADAHKRDAQVMGSLGDTISYDDPRTEAPITDKAALCAYVGQFLPMCPPGAKVEVAEPIDERRGNVRATVHFVMSEEMKQVGQYFLTTDGDGKITQIVGFVGKGAE